MLKVRVNGKSIRDYYPPKGTRETGLADVEADPRFKEAQLNGYCPEDFVLDDNLVLYLPLYRLLGTKFKSIDPYGHIATATSPTWGPQGRDFNPATPDYIEIPASSTQLNFTSGDFSIIARIYRDVLAGKRYIFCRGLESVDGYTFQVQDDNALMALTYQAGALQYTYSATNTIPATAWVTIGCSRSGAAMKVLINGVDATFSAGTHIDPLTCARSAKIGIYDDKSSSCLDGKIEFLLVYSRALSVAEHLHIHRISQWRNG